MSARKWDYSNREEIGNIEKLTAIFLYINTITFSDNNTFNMFYIKVRSVAIKSEIL